jgi:hypothetical protein
MSMTMDGSAFLDVARDLARGPTEAHRRTAAGRAYYALMLEARELLVRWGITAPPRDKVHHFVRLKLLFSSDADLRQVGLTLERLGQGRNDADYQLSDPRRRFQKSGPVEAAVRDSEMAIALLDQVDSDDARRAGAIASMQGP